MRKAFINAKVFTGEETLSGHAVIVDGGVIADVVAVQEIPEGVDIISLDGGWLVPAFVDIQIYGGNGLLFADHPSIESLQATYAYSLRGGASFILPTIATNAYKKIWDAADAVRAYQDAGLPGVLGLHVEGPYINPLKKGAHAEAFIRRPQLAEVKQLVERAKGTIRMITLAPEVCSDDIIDFLQSEKIIISAGHTNATYKEGVDAFSKNIRLATHLFNAMSPLQHRAPGMVGAIFNTAGVFSSIVADGHHVDFAAISIAKCLMKERLFYITDAVTENSEGLYQHRLDGDKYVLANGTLSGSALTMLKAVRNGVQYAGIHIGESFRMASLYPWQVFGRGNTHGRIRKEYQAELVYLDDQLQLKGIYTNSSLTRF